MKFTHLHLHTHYSLLDGLTRIEELADRVKALDMDSVAITDHGNMYGAIEFYKAVKSKGLKPIIGCEVYMAGGSMTEKNKDNPYYHLILLAKNKTGYQNLMRMVSEANLHGFYYKPRIDHELLEKNHEGLVCLSACLAGELSQFIMKGELKKAEETAKWYKNLFGEDYYIELQRHPNIEDQNNTTPRLLKLAKKLGIKVVATADSHYLNHNDAEIHDVLLAVQTKKKTSDEDRMTLSVDDFSVKSPEEMAELFADIPEAIENTQEVADKCNLELEFGKYQLPHFELPDGFTDIQYLARLSQDGLVKKGLDNKEYIDRLYYELSVIEKTNFASYLLIVADIIQWAKDHQVAVGPGRGSAAGSLICYCLGITNIDPIHYGLLFERFMNPDRISMPDIDMDFDEERRDLVLQYVNEKYGSDHVAQIITFGTMAGRGSIRDAGRAMGYDLADCDRIAKLIPPLTDLDEALDLVEELQKEYRDPHLKKLIDTAIRLEGVVRHVGTHACGIVISKDKTTDNMPIQLSSRGDGSLTTQYGMKPIEELGLLKMDFLGLNNLTIIRKTLEFVKERYGVDIDMDKIPVDDERTYKILKDARTTSVFQLESDGMKRYLKDLKPSDINDIAVMVALYRPGPMELIPEYIERKHGNREITYLHPSLEPVLKDTYGIMIYQEQLIKAVQVLAGFSLAQADVLRKAVGKKIKKLLDEQEEGFKEGCKKNGIPKKVADDFWALVEPFNRYGFNKSHAVCYGMIAYQTAYLKAHYPIEFMAAVINCDSTEIERLSFLIQEANDMGIDILPPDINLSSWGFDIDIDNKIRFGLSAIKGLGEEVVKRVVQERDLGNKFNGLSDFIRRVSHKSINKKVIDALTRAGSFDAFSNRASILLCIDQILMYGKLDEKDLLPAFKMPKIKDAPANQKLAWEKELLGLYVSENPVKRYKTRLSDERAVEVATLKDSDGDYALVGGIINGTKKIITKKGQPMMFCTLEDGYDKMEVVVFPTMYQKVKEIVKDNNIVVVGGKIEVTEDGRVKMVCMNSKLIDTIS